MKRMSRNYLSLPGRRFGFEAGFLGLSLQFALSASALSDYLIDACEVLVLIKCSLGVIQDALRYQWVRFQVLEVVLLILSFGIFSVQMILAASRSRQHRSTPRTSNSRHIG